MPVIKIRDLKKSFDGKPVLEGISMTVEQGDIYGFLGPNGSGKTTTLRILLGILNPDEGEIKVLGIDPAESGARLRGLVNALPESHGLYGWMTSENYLRLFGQIYGKDYPDADYPVKLKQVGLDPNDRRTIRTFSRGMKQRLGIARALINDPELLFLDEPTNGLDPRGRREIHDLLLTLNREKGLTIVISTHILDDVERLCNRIAILDNGRIRFEGNPAYESHHATRYRFRLEKDSSIPHPWNFPGIVLSDRGDGWITCLIKGITPADAIRKLVQAGLPVIEAVQVSGDLETLYLEFTEAGAK
jgi:ABC-2 type transport system ATP-binding protein